VDILGARESLSDSEYKELLDLQIEAQKPPTSSGAGKLSALRSNAEIVDSALASVGFKADPKDPEATARYEAMVSAIEDKISKRQPKDLAEFKKMLGDELIFGSAYTERKIDTVVDGATVGQRTVREGEREAALGEIQPGEQFRPSDAYRARVSALAKLPNGMDAIPDDAEFDEKESAYIIRLPGDLEQRIYSDGSMSVPTPRERAEWEILRSGKQAAVRTRATKDLEESIRRRTAAEREAVSKAVRDGALGAPARWKNKKAKQ
jgi:hypothetical protein